jgi:glycosyltransferase involved in cell wall biosynthesis
MSVSDRNKSTDLISAVIITHNEESNIPSLISNLCDCAEIIIVDDHSDDRTKVIAEQLGTIVIDRKSNNIIATSDDVRRFIERYRWIPSFHDNQVIVDLATLRNEALSYAHNDWILMLDADERVEWNFDIVSRLLRTADQISCQFIHSHNSDGSPRQVFRACRLFRRSKTQYQYRIHETIETAGTMIYSSNMKVHHWQASNHIQEYALPGLEYSVIKDQDRRYRFYLGREYYYHHEYDKALIILDEYLDGATWLPEIAQARLYKSKCFWESMRGDEARAECERVIMMNPDQKEALYLMSQMCYEPWKSKWKYIADNATNRDSLF